MASIRLTERSVASAAALAGQRLELFDQVTPGLILRVTDQGRKTWVVRYRTQDGRQPRLTLGTHPGLTLATARERALKVVADARDGNDPSAEKRRAKQAAVMQPLKTFDDLAARYLEVSVSGEYRPRGRAKRASTLTGEKVLLTTHVKPVLGTERLEAISRDTIRDLLRTVTAKGSKVSANRVLAFVRQVFNFAVAEGRLVASPVAGIRPPAVETPRTRTLSDAELERLWKTLSAPAGLRRKVGEGDVAVHLSPGVALALRLSLLLLQRRSEIAGMRLDELSLDQGVWLIRGDRMKNHEAHLVPLPPRASALIREAVKLSHDDNKPSPFVFPSPWDREKPITGGALTYALRNIYRALGITGATLHDLRRTGATAMASERLSIAPFVVSKVLGHSSDTGGGSAVTQQHYNIHDYAREKRAALSAWESLLAIVGNRSDDSNVVRLARLMS